MTDIALGPGAQGDLTNPGQSYADWVKAGEPEGPAEAPAAAGEATVPAAEPDTAPVYDHGGDL